MYEEFEIETQKQELLPTNILHRLQKEAALREDELQGKLEYLEGKGQ